MKVHDRSPAGFTIRTRNDRQLTSDNAALIVTLSSLQISWLHVVQIRYAQFPVLYQVLNKQVPVPVDVV